MPCAKPPTTMQTRRYTRLLALAVRADVEMSGRFPVREKSLKGCAGTFDRHMNAPGLKREVTNVTTA